MGGRVKVRIELMISCFDIMLNYRLSQKLKLLGNGEFNHLNLILKSVFNSEKCSQVCLALVLSDSFCQWSVWLVCIECYPQVVALSSMSYPWLSGIMRLSFFPLVESFGLNHPYRSQPASASKLRSMKVRN